MRRFSLLLALVASCASPASRAECPDAPVFDGNHIVVELCSRAEGCAADVTLEAFEAAFGSRLVPAPDGALHLDWLPQIRLAEFEVAGGPAAADQFVLDAMASGMAQEAERQEHVEIPEGVQRAIPDLLRSGSLALFESQPASLIVHALEARPVATGQRVTVAIVDTGASLTNPVTSGRIVGGIDVMDGGPTVDVPPNGVDDDGDTLVDESAHHGTHVAGMVHLVAPDAALLHVRVLDDEGTGSVFDIARGIIAAHEHGAKVINLSLGIPHGSEAIKGAIRHVTARGTVVVTAAGNRGNLATPCLDFPGDEAMYWDRDRWRGTEGLASVAAVDDALVRAAFSSYGPEVTLSAPGVALLSTWADDWAGWDGTSFATPMVAGAAALVLQRYPSLSPQQVVELLTGTTQPFGAPQSGMGSGVLDVGAAAITALRERDTLLVAKDGAGASVLHWTEVLDATRYDVVRGAIANLRLDGAGNVDLGPVTCLGQAAPGPDAIAADAAPVPPGGAFYLVRDDAPGASWGRSSRREPRVPAGGCP